MVEIVPAFSYPSCVALRNDDVELLITTDVGPRVLGYRLLPDGGSPFKTYEEELGRDNEFEWQIRGGHRLWIAPEERSLTYIPDNRVIRWESQHPLHASFRNEPVAPWNLAKILSLTLDPTGSRVTVSHQIVNDGDLSITLAPWALSVMAPGGCLLLPQPPLGEHPRDLLPNRSLIIWPYSDLSDPRLSMGTRFIRLQQQATESATVLKFGTGSELGCALYVLGDQVFFKTFPWKSGANYPDQGCNFETFTDNGMLEVESLGPIVHLAPGEKVEHTEEWLLRKLDIVPDLADESAWLAITESLKEEVSK